MSTDYSTIQQHQPLRTPKSFDKEGKALVLQIDEVFDDIYRRFGRLRLEDMGKAFRKEFADAEGNISQLVLDVNGLSTRVQSAEGDISQLNVWAGAIELQVADKYDKVSGITITSAGIDITGSKYIQMGAGSSIDILSGGTFTVASGNFGIDAQGNAYFNGGGTFSGNLQAAGGTFAGNLQAAGGTFAGTLSANCIQGGTIDANEVNIVNLKVDYAQMLGATIGDLVIQASNSNYYRLDVAADGTVTAVRVYPSAAEIAQGYTSAGQKIYSGTDIPATDLTTTDIYESRDLAGKINGSSEVDVDQMFERQDFTDNMNAQDLTENTSFQTVVGDWVSQSTMTQAINSLSARIDQLGYGTIFYSETEPSHDNLVAGDIWIEPVDDNTWDDISQYTWADLSSMTWEQVAGKYRMYVWTGTTFKTLFDNLIVSELEDEIAAVEAALSLKADKTTVNTLSGQVTAFATELNTQSQVISAAVASVNTKTANYVRLTDPSSDQSITLRAGDVWTKSPGNGTWTSAGDFTWNQLADLTWDEIAGASAYTWSGSEWTKTAGYGMTERHDYELNEAKANITALESGQASLTGRVRQNELNISSLTSQLAKETERATAAESGKIDKTSTYPTAASIYTAAVNQAATSAAGLYIPKTGAYPTAASIVTAAVNQAATSAAGLYIAKTNTYQTAASIVSSANSYADSAAATAETNAKNASILRTGAYTTAASIVTAAVNQAATAAAAAYIAKTNAYQTAASIVTAAVNQAETSADSNYIKKTSSYQTADAIVSEAVSQSATSANNTFLKKTTQYQTADAIVSEAVSQASTSAGSTYLKKTTKYQTADAIVSEAVSQSSTAAGSTYLKKTTKYQSADAIVTEAVSQAATGANNTYLKKTSTYQSADAIISTAESYANGAANTAEANAKNASIAKTNTYKTVNDLLTEAQNKADAAATTAKNASIAKTQVYQDAQSIVNTAVAAAATAAGETYIAKTNVYQTADSIVSEAETYVDNKLTDYSTITQTANSISLYVTNNAYKKVSGITITANGIDISGSQYVKIASGGYFQVKTGDFGIDTNSSTYVMWSGASSATGSGVKFRLKKDGSLTVTKLMILGENGSETAYDLRSGSLWKLNYQTIKQGTITTSGGYCTGFTLSNGTALTFKSATVGWAEAVAKIGSYDLDEEGAWIELDVPSASYGQQTAKGYDLSTAFTNQYNKAVAKGVTIGDRVGTTKYYAATVKQTDDEDKKLSSVDCSTPFDDGATGAGLSATWSGATLSVSRVTTGATKTFSVTISGAWSSNTYQVKRDSTLLFGTTVTAAATLTYDSSTHTYTATPTASAGNVVRHTGTAKTSGTEAYKDGWNAARADQTTIGTCYEITAHSGEWVKVRDLGTGYSRVPSIS